jgi:hypothetical protein
MKYGSPSCRSFELMYSALGRIARPSNFNAIAAPGECVANNHRYDVGPHDTGRVAPKVGVNNPLVNRLTRGKSSQEKDPSRLAAE